MKTNSKYFVARVTDNDENFDNSSDAAFIEITPSLKELILKTSLKIDLIKKELNSNVYDIRLFNNNIIFLGSGVFEDNTDSNMMKELYDKGSVKIQDSLLRNLLEKSEDFDKHFTVRVETILLQISRNTFQWTGYYKHTNIRVQTDSILISNL